MIDTIMTLISALAMLFAAWLLWQRANQPTTINYPATIQSTPRPSFVPPVAPPLPPVQVAPPFEEETGGTISPETLAAWAAADAADAAQQMSDVIRPSWGKTLYESLGIPSDAPTDQIRTAYREQCRVWHPDQNDDPDAATEFDIINKAYKILTTQRSQYDAGLSIEEETN